MTAFTLMVETDLLSRLRAGDEDAFAYFVRHHTGRMLALARGFLHNEDDAADAVQDAFLSAFKSLGRFEGNSSLGTWLHRIVVNTCLMKIRSKSRRKTYSIEELLPTFDETGHHVQPVAPWSENGYERMANAETKAQVGECINQLPEHYRTVLVMRDIEEFDTEQTAAVLGLNPGAVKTRLHRARQALRTLLNPFMENDPLAPECINAGETELEGDGDAPVD
jgi:RNA polymerase sigma-70 factor, ECF subfamily